jgi:RNA polymerase sigma factor (sigma-70 family)
MMPPAFTPMDDPQAETTLSLFQRASDGDRHAADLLFARYAPALQRWARGRLPRWARDIADTSDLVQDAMLQTFRNLARVEYRGTGALHAYLRQAVLNRVREELRRRGSRPEREALDPSMPEADASPLERAIGRQQLARYEAALEKLDVEDREAVIARLEWGLSHRDIADALGKPSPDAARMTVARALARLAREMDKA